jgi:hypothetical protein
MNELHFVAPLEELTVAYIVKKFFAFYGGRRFTDVLTRARLRYLYRIEQIQSAYFHPVTLR